MKDWNWTEIKEPMKETPFAVTSNVRVTGQFDGRYILRCLDCRYKWYSDNEYAGCIKCER